MSNPHLLVHDKRDNVGVVVVEGLAAGTDMLCVVTEDNSDFRMTAKAEIYFATRKTASAFVHIR